MCQHVHPVPQHPLCCTQRIIPRHAFLNEANSEVLVRRLCLSKLVLCACGAVEWREQSEEQKKRTEQLILDTSAREAELLLRNRELSQQASLLLRQACDSIVTIVLHLL